MEDRFNQNYFELFNMEVKTNIDHKNLDQKYNTYQKQFHPDNFVYSTNYEKKLSLKYISYINEAYKTLKNDKFFLTTFFITNFYTQISSSCPPSQTCHRTDNTF